MGHPKMAVAKRWGSWNESLITGRRKRGAQLRDKEIGGTAAADVIDAGDGDDVVKSGEGDDDVDGDAGNDSISGGKGNDDLGGDAGSDTLIGGKGADTLNGGEGDDLLISGNGGDTYVISRGNDTIDGFGRDDQLLLSSDLVEAGLKPGDLNAETTSLDGRNALVLSFELDGEQHSTTILGNKREIQAAEDSVLEIQTAGVSYSTDQTLTTLKGTTLELNESLQIDAFDSNDTIVATVAFSSSAPSAVKFQLTETSGIKPSYGYSLTGEKSEVSFEGTQSV